MTEKDYKEYCMKFAKKVEWFYIWEDGDRKNVTYDIGKTISFNQWTAVKIWIEGWKAGFNDGRLAKA